MAQYLRPNGESSTVWIPSNMSSCWPCIDEATLSTSDYITGNSAKIQICTLSSASAPTDKTNHKLVFNAQRRDSGEAQSISVTLKQGSTTIYSSGLIALNDSATNITRTLSEAQAGDITDYSALTVSISCVDDFTRYARLNQLYFEIPDAPITPLGLEMGCSF